MNVEACPISWCALTRYHLGPCQEHDPQPDVRHVTALMTDATADLLREFIPTGDCSDAALEIAHTVREALSSEGYHIVKTADTPTRERTT